MVMSLQRCVITKMQILILTAQQANRSNTYARSFDVAMQVHGSYTYERSLEDVIIVTYVTGTAACTT